MYMCVSMCIYIYIYYLLGCIYTVYTYYAITEHIHTFIHIITFIHSYLHAYGHAYVHNYLRTCMLTRTHLHKEGTYAYVDSQTPRPCAAPSHLQSVNVNL